MKKMGLLLRETILLKEDIEMAKTKRKIIKINEELCNGCGNCIPACPEQAIQLIDTPSGKKARLVSEIYCDGLGACLGACPAGALEIVELESEPYNEEATIARIKEKSPEMLATHLTHLKEHSQDLPDFHHHKIPECPSAKVSTWTAKGKKAKIESELRQWPIQLHLVSPRAPYFRNAKLLIAADCVPFAYADFHNDFLKGKTLIIGCPKLDDIESYILKLSELFQYSDPKSIDIIHMEVPCCFGLVSIVQEALKQSKKKLAIKSTTISIKGEILNTQNKEE